MRPGAKILFFSLVVFLFSFLTSLAGQPNFEGDAKRIKGKEKELLREKRFGPNPYFRSEWFRSTVQTSPEEFQKGLVPYAEPFDLERHRPGRPEGIPFQHSSNAPLTIAEQRVMQSIIDDFLVNDDSIGGYNYRGCPAIARAPSGNFVITWEDRRYGYLNGYSDIFAQRYDSNGASIGSNFKVNDASSPYTGKFPAIAIDDSGNFVITWGDDLSGDWDVYAQRFDSAGTPLGSNFKVNDDAGTSYQDYPEIAMNGLGNFVITWTDRRNGNLDGFAQRYDPSGTPAGSNFKVNDDTTFRDQYSDDIAMDALGNFVITLSDSRKAYAEWDIFAQRYDSDGTPLGSNFKVNDDTAPHWQASSCIAMDDSDDFVITWQDRRNVDLDVYAQRYNSLGIPLGLNFEVSEDSSFWAWHPAISSDGSGNFVITWHDDRYPNYGIYAQRYDSSGNPLGPNFKVDDTDQSTDYPAIASDKSGKFVITWMDYRNDTLDAFPLNVDIYAQMYDSAGNSLGANFRVCDDFGVGEQSYPAIEADSFGNFVIAWDDHRSAYHGSIYFQRYNSSGTPLDSNYKVGGGTWPAIAMGGSGNYVITWSSEGTGIWSQRYNSVGIPMDTIFRVNDDTTGIFYQLPQVAVDGSDNFVITWRDYRNGNYNPDIYAQRYDSAGTPIGSNFRVNDGTGATSENNPAVASDKAGNFVIVWNDARSGTDIYAQRYDSTGIPLGSNIKVSDAGTYGYAPAIAMEGSGNFVVTWTGSGFIYAQRYDSSGLTLGSNFKVTDNVPSVAEFPTIAVDNFGNFVIAWGDYRQGIYDNPDIYAQRYDASGNPIGGNYLVNNAQSISFAQFYPAVAANSSNIYFTWQDNRRAKGWDIYAKVVDWQWTKVGEDEIVGLPNSFELLQNYPNPFNPTTAIPFRVGGSQLMVHSSVHATLKIYNILGQSVKTLVDEEKLPGNYKVIWDGKDDSGKDVASGIYFYQLKTKDYTATKKMVLLR